MAGRLCPFLGLELFWCSCKEDYNQAQDKGSPEYSALNRAERVSPVKRTTPTALLDRFKEFKCEWTE